MPVTDVTKDLDTRTLTITAHFDAPVERVWQLYADPRQLERVWGPPTHPATFVEHDLVPGGRMIYYMTGPEGEHFGGWWQIGTVDEPRRFTFDDGFADADLKPVDDLPVSHNEYSFEADADGSYLVGLTESQITDVPVTSMMGLMDRTFRRPKNPWWLQLRDVTRAVAEEPEPADA